jgi:hypothetical protein
MRIVYLANVGTRDIQRSDGIRITQPRQEGEKYLAQYNEYKTILTAPILAKGIERVLQTIGDRERIDLVQLFVTDQLRSTPEKYRDADTIHFGSLLQLLLKDQFGTRLEKVECESMRFNPADYSKTLNYYERTLRELLPPASLDLVYVAPVGGADPSNTGLTFDAVRLYRDKCQFLYVAPGQDAQVIDLHRRLLADYEREQALGHLDRHDYGALGSAMERARLGRTWHSGLCAYIDRRSRFDFRRAKEELDRAMSRTESADDKAILNQVIHEFQPLLSAPESPTSQSSTEAWDEYLQWQGRLISELYYNLWLKTETCEWVDVLGRLFRMREALQRFLFESEVRHATSKFGGQFSDFEVYLNKNEDVRLHLESKGWQSSNVYVGNETLDIVIGHWCRTSPNRAAKCGKLLRLNKIGTSLADLRNQTIIAHGFRGVGLEDIGEFISIEDLRGKLQDALGALGLSHHDADNPYLRVRQILRPAL